MSDAMANIAPNPGPEAGGEPLRVLIAEDDVLLAASLKEDLHELGYHTLGPATDGERAVELAKIEKPDLALVDIRMPGRDGLDTASILYKRMDIPVVLVTAYSDPEYVDAGQRIGVFGYLLKPVNIDDLRVSIPVAWSRYREREQLRGEVQHMKVALEDRKFVERAKGLLMDRLKLSESGAMRRLQKQARDSRRSLPDLARAIVDADQMLQGRDSARGAKSKS